MCVRARVYVCSESMKGNVNVKMNDLFISKLPFFPLSKLTLSLSGPQSAQKVIRPTTLGPQAKTKFSETKRT